MNELSPFLDWMKPEDVEPVGEEDEMDEEANEQLLPSEEMIMCMIYQSKIFSCVYYDFISKRISYLVDTMDDGGKFELANLLISDLRPAAVITCTKSDENFVKFLRNKCKYNNLDDNDPNYLSRLELNEDDAAAERDRIEFVVTANVDFNYESAEQIIMSLTGLEGMTERLNEIQRRLYFRNVINFEARQSVRCLGALLTFLTRHADKFNLEKIVTRDGVHVPVLSIRPLKMDQLLMMDHNTFKSLQIFNDVDLRYAFRQTRRDMAASFRTKLNTKPNSNSSTLYALFMSKISTKIGIGKLRSFMLRPTRDPDTLAERHAVIEYLISYRNKSFVDTLKKALNKCKYISTLFKKMRVAARSNWTEWKRLYTSTKALCEIAELARFAYEEIQRHEAANAASSTINPRASSFTAEFDDLSSISFQESEAIGLDIETKKKSNRNLFEEIAKRDFNVKFRYLIELFDHIVDVKKSDESKKLSINLNIVPELDEKRALLGNLAEELTRIAQQEQETYSLDECRVVYIPLIKFLTIIHRDTFLRMLRIMMKSLDESAYFNLSLNDESADLDAETERNLDNFRASFEQQNGLSLSFTCDNKYYYKTEAMINLDRIYGDLLLEIRDLETDAVTGLQQRFIKYSHYYADMLDLTAELDCLLAFAIVAQENSYSRPSLHFDRDSYVFAERVRHPLVERLLSDPSMFIPNEVQSDSDCKFKIITGPNASGKTIYMKQVALLVYMTMIGSYVAASGRIEIGDFDRIFTRLYSNECITYELSSFAFDLRQISDAVQGATSKSLVVIDEIGKGTDIALGKSVVIAIVKHWAEISARRLPHILMSTHFYDIFQMNGAHFFNSTNRIDYITLDFLIEQGKSAIASLVFMYKLKKGVSDSSYALNIAQKSGLPDRIVEKASQIQSLLTRCSHSNSDLESLQVELESLFANEVTETEFQECKRTVVDSIQLHSQLSQISEIELKINTLKSFLRSQFSEN